MVILLPAHELIRRIFNWHFFDSLQTAGILTFFKFDIAANKAYNYNLIFRSHSLFWSWWFEFSCKGTTGEGHNISHMEISESRLRRRGQAVDWRLPSSSTCSMELLPLHLKNASQVSICCKWTNKALPQVLVIHRNNWFFFVIYEASFDTWCILNLICAGFDTYREMV